jgi:hypothetical protein
LVAGNVNKHAAVVHRLKSPPADLARVFQHEAAEGTKVFLVGNGARRGDHERHEIHERKMLALFPEAVLVLVLVLSEAVLGSSQRGGDTVGR